MKTISVNVDESKVIHIYDLCQWDYGICLDLSEMGDRQVEVHFSLTDGYGVAEVRYPVEYLVSIPQFIFENEYEEACVYGEEYRAYGYLYITEADAGYTMKKMIFHIQSRARPDEYVHTEEEVKKWVTLEGKIEEVSQSLENCVRDLIGVKDIFLAEYGVTTYDEIVTVYKEGKEIILFVPNGKLESVAATIYAPLTRVDKNIEVENVYNFAFTCIENNKNHHFVMTYNSKVWTYYGNELASYEYLRAVDKNWQSANSNLNSYISRHETAIQKFTPLLTSAFNSFRGGFREAAGVLNINAPGIYIVMQAGSGNKNIVITQEGKEALNEKWNGVIVLSSDTGVVTPVGIKSGLTQWATPGTYQGWVKGSTDYTTTISYPENAVVWYMGNSNVDIGK